MVRHELHFQGSKDRASRAKEFWWGQVIPIKSSHFSSLPPIICPNRNRPQRWTVSKRKLYFEHYGLVVQWGDEDKVLHAYQSGCQIKERIKTSVSLVQIDTVNSKQKVYSLSHYLSVWKQKFCQVPKYCPQQPDQRPGAGSPRKFCLGAPPKRWWRKDQGTVWYLKWERKVSQNLENKVIFK